MSRNICWHREDRHFRIHECEIVLDISCLVAATLPSRVDFFVLIKEVQTLKSK